MNANKKKAAVEKYGNFKGDDLVFELENSEKGYTQEEIVEIVEAIQNHKAESTTVVEKPKNVVKPPDGIDLSFIDYKDKVSGESFAKYLKLTEGLDVRKKYDFEVYRVRPIRRERYKNIKGTDMVVRGMEIVREKPHQTARVPLSDAIVNNGRAEWGEDDSNKLDNVVGAQWTDMSAMPSNSFKLYYFLKK